MADAFPNLDVAGAGCLRTLRPGSRFVCFYDDDEVWHERYALWPANRKGTAWYIFTPDQDLYAERLDHGDEDDGPRLLRAVRDGGKLPTLNRRCYRFDEPLTDQDIRRHIRAARREAEAAGFIYLDAPVSGGVYLTAFCVVGRRPSVLACACN